MQLDDYLALRPEPGTPTDSGNPIANGLWANYVFNEMGGKEVFDKGNFRGNPLSFFTVGSDPVWNGWGVEVGNSKGYVRDNTTINSSFNPVRGSHTVRVVHIPRNWPSTYTALLDVQGTGTVPGDTRLLSIFCSTTGAISYRGIGSSSGAIIGSTETQPIGQISDLVWVRAFGDGTSGSTSTHYWYINGKLTLTEQALLSTDWPSNGYNFAVGGNPTGGGAAYDGTYLQVQCWDRALSPREVAWLAGNPYGLMSNGPLYTFGRSNIVSNTGTVSSIGTITLTAPTVTVIADVTATVGTIGTITLTAPTCQALPEATVSSIGTITLTAPAVTAYALTNTATVSTIGTIFLQTPTVHPIGERPPNNYQQQFFWGRFSRGQYLNVMFQPLYIPDDIPTVKFWHEATTVVRTFTLPVTDPDDVVFGMPILLDADFDDGHYVVTITFEVDHAPYTVICYLEVIGGLSSSPVLELLEIDRSIGRGVAFHMGNGFVRIGYHPSLSGELT